MEGDEESDGDRAEEVGDEVPAGVDESADIGFWEDASSEEFDDFVEGTESGSGGDTESEESEGGLNRNAALTEGFREALPADPGDESESVEVDELVELQPAGDDPPVVKDACGSLDGPGVGDVPESARHVGRSPEGESEESGEIEADVAVDGEDGREHGGHDGQVDFELGVAVTDGGVEGDGHIGSGEEDDSADDGREERRALSGEVVHECRLERSSFFVARDDSDSFNAFS